MSYFSEHGLSCAAALLESRAKTEAPSRAALASRPGGVLRMQGRLALEALSATSGRRRPEGEPLLFAPLQRPWLCRGLCGEV